MSIAAEADFATQRQTMVDCQIRTFDVTDPVVIDRFLAVPRERFLPSHLQALAYSDATLEIRAAQETRVLLAPLVLARMMQGAGLVPTDRVLDVAGAAGYSAALLAGLALEVVSLESDAALSAQAAANFAAAGLTNAHAVAGALDASNVSGSFDLIFVNGAVEDGLDALLAKLTAGGRLIAIQMIAGHAGKVTRFEKVGSETSRRVLFNAAAPVLSAFAARKSFVF